MEILKNFTDVQSFLNEAKAAGIAASKLDAAISSNSLPLFGQFDVPILKKDSDFWAKVEKKQKDTKITKEEAIDAVKAEGENNFSHICITVKNSPDVCSLGLLQRFAYIPKLNLSKEVVNEDGTKTLKPLTGKEEAITKIEQNDKGNFVLKGVQNLNKSFMGDQTHIGFNVLKGQYFKAETVPGYLIGYKDGGHTTKESAIKNLDVKDFYKITLLTEMEYNQAINKETANAEKIVTN